MAQTHRRPRDNLDSRGNPRMGKSISNGFGIVRKLTTASQIDIFDYLDEAEINNSMVRRKPPLHLTIVQFIKMSRQEQTAFHAGFNVARLEKELANGVQKDAPRKAIGIELGAISFVGNFLYAEVDDPRLVEEQVKLVGQIALHGIKPNRIDRNVVPPHVGIGYNQQGPIEDMRASVEEAISGKHAALQRWIVYPDRYA